MKNFSVPILSILLATAANGLAGETYEPTTDRWIFANLPETESHSLVCPTGVRPQGWDFTPEVRVNDPTPGFHLWPDVAIGRSDTLHAIWMDERTGRYRIYCSYSTDYGLTWSPDELVDNSPTGMCRFPAVAADRAGGVYALWEDSRAGLFDVYFSSRVWSETVFVWTPSQKINDAGSSPGAGDYMNASITAGARGHVYAAWTDWREGVYHQVYSSVSTDGGANWTPDSRISDEVGVDPVAADPSLLVDPDDSLTVYCVFNDWREPHGPRYPEVYFSKSTDGGATWGANVKVNDISPYYQQAASRVIGVDGHDLIYVMWFNWDSVNLPETRANVSEDGGLSFGSSSRVNDDPASEVGTYPSLAVDVSGRAFGVWMDSRDGHWNIYFSTSSDTARTWLPNVRVDTSEANTSDYNPVVTVDEERRVGVIWSYYPHGQNYEIVFSMGLEETLGVASEPSLPGTLPPLFLEVAPNPSAGWCRVSYTAPTPAMLGLYDSAGRLVERLALEPRRHIITWPAGLPLPSGNYFLVLEADRERTFKKLSLIR